MNIKESVIRFALKIPSKNQIVWNQVRNSKFVVLTLTKRLKTKFYVENRKYIVRIALLGVLIAIFKVNIQTLLMELVLFAIIKWDFR